MTEPRKFFVSPLMPRAARQRFVDPMGGDRLTMERQQHVPTYYPPSHGKRYCEGCQQYHPKPKGPAVKGWRCPVCRKQIQEKT